MSDRGLHDKVRKNYVYATGYRYKKSSKSLALRWWDAIVCLTICV